jgi:hypothetical protein
MSDASTLFKLLAAETRRRVLVSLCETESVRIPDDVLVRSGATARGTPAGGGRGSASTGSPSSRSLELELRHNHLPKLAAEGFVEWDPRAGVAARGPRFGEVEPVLRLLVANADAFPSDLV